MQRIYLDHNASTPVDPQVIQAILQELQEGQGNPSSQHYHGQTTQRTIEKARRLLSDYLGVKSQEIIWTSGGTEGANLALQGVFQGCYKGHIITSEAEHSAVYQTIKALEERGCTVTFLPVGPWGAVQVEAVKAAIQSDTRLITLMAVNNETGVKTDIEAVSILAQEAGIPLIVDGVALLGKESFKIPRGVSAMFFSGHKLHAPVGVGALFCRQTLKLTPLFLGGHQEFNKRAGSANLPGIVGFAAAIEILKQNQIEFTAHMQQMRDRLEIGLQSHLPQIKINGQGPRIVNTSSISFLGVDGESLLIHLDQAGLSASHGSACSSGALEPSRILLNMGLTLAQARSTIRFSVSRQTTLEEIDQALAIIIRAVNHLRR